MVVTVNGRIGKNAQPLAALECDRDLENATVLPHNLVAYPAVAHQLNKLCVWERLVLVRYKAPGC